MYPRVRVFSFRGFSRIFAGSHFPQQRGVPVAHSSPALGARGLRCWVQTLSESAQLNLRFSDD